MCRAYQWQSNVYVTCKLSPLHTLPVQYFCKYIFLNNIYCSVAFTNVKIGVHQTLTLIALVMNYFVFYNEYVASNRQNEYMFVFICLVFLNSNFCHFTVYEDKGNNIINEHACMCFYIYVWRASADRLGLYNVNKGLAMPGVLVATVRL